jgi:transcriptional regulator with XRE-family HTH domain
MTTFEMTSAEELAHEIRERRHRTGLTQQQFAAQLPGCDRSRLSRVETGRELPSVALARAIEKASGLAIPSLVDLRWQAWHDQHLDELGLAGFREPPSNVSDDAEGIAFGIAIGAAQARAIGHLLFQSRRHETALRDVAFDLDDLAKNFYSTPTARLLALLTHQHQLVERALFWRPQPQEYRRLVSLAAESTYLLARLCFGTGHEEATRTYIILATEYAKHSEDRLLASCVANLDGCYSLYHRFGSQAADAAQQARQRCHPLARARLLAVETAAHATCGQLDRACETFYAFRAALAHPPQQMGYGLSREIVYLALTPSDLAEDSETRRDTCARLGAQNATHALQAGQAWASVARAFLDERHGPDPIAAIEAARLALTAAAISPDPDVRDRVHQVHHDLQQQWPDLDETLALGRLLVDPSPTG